MATIYTIGHSTRSLEELIEALQAHDELCSERCPAPAEQEAKQAQSPVAEPGKTGIKLLVDIRSYPMSRRLPWFNRESLEQELPKAGIQYRWMKDLGGRRKKQMEHSPNTALRNDSFRNYADYMLSEPFKAAIAELIELAHQQPTAIMCAERVYFRCHRMLVSDWLVAHGHEVLHIDATGPVKPHKLMGEAQLRGDDVVYPGLV